MTAHALPFDNEQPNRGIGALWSLIARRGRRADARRRALSSRLVRRAQRGQRRAFEALWLGHAPTVRGILLTMVDETLADDLAQEVAITAFRALPSLQNVDSFPSWLCAIARNTGRDALATRRRLPETSLDEVDADRLAAPASGDPTTADEILAAIRSLPECHREPLMLRLQMEMTGPEIAARTGMTAGSVRVNLCKGMKLLRQRLAHLDPEADDFDDGPDDRQG